MLQLLDDVLCCSLAVHLLDSAPSVPKTGGTRVRTIPIASLGTTHKGWTTQLTQLQVAG